MVMMRVFEKILKDIFLIYKILKRYDSKKRLLKTGEIERSDGYYQFFYTDRKGKRHSVTAKSLTELREKEDKVTKDRLDGLRDDGNNITFRSANLTIGRLIDKENPYNNIFNKRRFFENWLKIANKEDLDGENIFICFFISALTV